MDCKLNLDTTDVKEKLKEITKAANEATQAINRLNQAIKNVAEGTTTKGGDLSIFIETIHSVIG